MNLKNMNWKTTTAGIAAILVAVGVALTALTDGNPETNIDYAVLVSSVLAGVGLIMARDGDKSSEQVGAGK